MQIKYDEDVDGFVVAVRQQGQPEVEFYVDAAGREKKRIKRGPGKLLFLKFLREEDFNEWNREYQDGRFPDDSEYGGYIIRDDGDVDVVEGVEWEERTYVPRLTRIQLSPQKILDYKEMIRARNLKPDVLPVDPVVNREPGNPEPNFGRIDLPAPPIEEIRAIARHYQPQWVNGLGEPAQAPEAIQHGNGGNGPAFGAREIAQAAEQIYYQRGGAQGAELRFAGYNVNLDHRPAAIEQPPIDPANDPNRVIPAADRNPF